VKRALQDSAAPCVLIVDDDPLVLHALETTVQSAEYPVVATEDPKLGLECLESRAVSVVIADQRMDAMTGLELLGHARRLQPHASRILITGLLSVKTLTDAVNCGEIYRFIAKPWSTPELIATVHNAVHRYQLLCENAALHEEARRTNNELLAEKQALEERLSQLTFDKAELERVLATFRATRGGIFEFCDAILTAFDGALGARTRRTVEVCGLLADAAGLSSDIRDNLIASAWVHDLGLIAVRRSPELHPLHDAAGAELRDHPALGERLALASGLGEVVASAVRAHHESFDGGGFPDRLRGRQIPEIARWLTPVAYFVSCGLSRQQAIEEIERLSGVAFDPQVIPYLLRIALSLPSPDAIALASPASPAAESGSALRRAYLQAETRA
jgi:response regulator RpfG family c-di-GMP phosphodiesterase